VKGMIYCGIDVSSRTLDVAIDVGRGPVWTGVFDNTESGHRKLVRKLGGKHRGVRVVVEATGVYHLDLALALRRSKSIDVMVANPMATKGFAKAHMQRSKTDKTDALSILEFARRMEFKPWTPPAPEILDLRALARHIASLATMRAQEKNRLHAHSRVAERTPALRDSIERHIEDIDHIIEDLQDEALRLIEGSKELGRHFEHLISIKCLAKTSAIAILAEIVVLPKDMTVRQWVAHAGLDPRLYESGISVKAMPRISKVGNRNLRRALFMPALVASNHEPRIKAYYEHLLENGKAKMQALVAVMRKLLHSIHGMFEHDQDFDGEKFFATGA
jgi:transposase